MGTAYRTPISPTVYTPATGDVAAVYAVHPPARFERGRSETPYVIVASSNLVGDTVVYPCDSRGQMLAWDILAWVSVRIHRTALKEAGYDLEVMTHAA